LAANKQRSQEAENSSRPSKAHKLRQNSHNRKQKTFFEESRNLLQIVQAKARLLNGSMDG